MLGHSGFDVYSDQSLFIGVPVPLFLLFGDGVYALRSLALGVLCCWVGQHFEVLLLGMQLLVSHFQRSCGLFGTFEILCCGYESYISL